MTTKLILTIGLSIPFLFCRLTQIYPQNIEVNYNLTHTSKEKNKDTIAYRNIEQIIFGKFCGACYLYCTIMFRYNMIGDQNSLFADYTNSYLKNKDNIIFPIQITDSVKFNLASDIINHIPNELLKTKINSETYGCPDCHDGCGFYFEIQSGSTKKKFYIDTQRFKLASDDLKIFSDYLHEMIDKMRK